MVTAAHDQSTPAGPASTRMTEPDATLATDPDATPAAHPDAGLATDPDAGLATDPDTTWVTGPEAGRATDPASALAAARRLSPRLAERAAEHDAAGRFPAADFDDLRAAGLLGLMVPARLGGCGASFADYAAVAAELAAGSGATALIFNMHASVTGALAQTPDELVRQLGAPESFFAERDRVLAAAAAGALYAVAMSERGAGSRLSRLRTSYRPAAEGFHLTGSKAFVSAAGHADAYLVAARAAGTTGTTGTTGTNGTDGRAAGVDEQAGAAEPRVSYFLVPAGDGVTVEPTWDALGMRATGSHDLHLDVVRPGRAARRAGGADRAAGAGDAAVAGGVLRRGVRRCRPLGRALRRGVRAGAQPARAAGGARQDRPRRRGGGRRRAGGR